MTHLWPRRDWLRYHVTLGATLVVQRLQSSRRAVLMTPSTVAPSTSSEAQAARWDVGPVQALALEAVDAAHAAGAHYADARLTRTVTHRYGLGIASSFSWDQEDVGVGVRVLVNGYWGFAAGPFRTSDAVVQLARDAVAQATVNAKGPPRVVELGSIPVATGTWETPMAIDPFSISIEEKLDYGEYWISCAGRAGLSLGNARGGSHIVFERQERVLASSEGTLVTQTQSVSGAIVTGQFGQDGLVSSRLWCHEVDFAGGGWEILLDGKLPDRIAQMGEDALLFARAGTRPATVGRYTLVCDGRTMAALVNATLGLATQLDRALGYEANASGSSFLDDPMAMIGNALVTSPLVTLTANRSMPRELATVRWDDEGVVPEPFTLIRDGVLTDFQTTREQAGWLAPYYKGKGQPVRSHGCAAAQDAHCITMQHTPNLSLEPNASTVRLEDLIASVPDGILIEDGDVGEVDWQERNGLLGGNMRRITNGRVGPLLTGGTILFNTADLWKHVQAIGGVATQATRAVMRGYEAVDKGEPPQQSSHSVRAVAATIANQPLINVDRKA